MRLSSLIRLALLSLLLLGCFWVLQPFVTALLFALIVCVSTWPMYQRLLAALGERQTLSSAVMVMALVLGCLLPLVWVASQLATNLSTLLNGLHVWLQQGVQGIGASPPDWLLADSWLAGPIQLLWDAVASGQIQLMKLVQMGFEPIRMGLFKGVSLFAEGVLQLSLMLLIAFFIYRDAQRLLSLLRTSVRKLGGELGEALLLLTTATIRGVMNGIVGTALAQALVMMMGLWIAAVPSVGLLGVCTFFLSLIPVGPPLVWGGAALWLYAEGQVAWAVFMVLYGLLVVSSVDNVLKPVLISSQAKLPLLLIAAGVLGGMVAFGFVGIFLGPVLLALAHALLLNWISGRLPLGRTEGEQGSHD